jgi:hypothetical protein
MLRCPTHQYYGPSKVSDIQPTIGCKQCWLTYYFHDVLSVPPSERQHRMEEIFEVVSNLNRMYETGKWDYTPNPDNKVELSYDKSPGDKSPLMDR